MDHRIARICKPQAAIVESESRNILDRHIWFVFSCLLSAVRDGNENKKQIIFPKYQAVMLQHALMYLWMLRSLLCNALLQKPE
jgi:hypothetical protein